MTALHMAAEDGSVDCLELLLEAKANVHVVTHRLRTALHLAALAQSADCVSLLLRAHAAPNAEDCDRRTPLHNAIVKGYGNLECVKILLENGADPNRQDCYGYTPLHLAALNEYSSCIKLLMDKGADITIKTKGGSTALSFIIRKTPSMVECISEIFDRAITLSDDNNDRDMEVKMDYRVLVPRGKTESHLLITLITEGQKHFLKHPLCESFLHQKWEKVRKFFFFHLSGYAVFVIMLTIYTLYVFRNECLKPNGACAGNHTKQSNDSGCFEYVANLPKTGYLVNVPLRYEWYALLCFTVIMVAKEIIELWLYSKMYFFHVENWLQWAVIAHVFILTDINRETKCVLPWQYHVAAVGILLAWGEVMLMIGRLPEFGLYVQMFSNVAKEFGKFLFAYVWFIIAFSFSFSIVFFDMNSFYASLPYGIIKTLIMMTGEFEYEELFQHKDLGSPYTDYPGTTEILFFLFLLFGTVVLMNLLVGMAVNDISGLQKTARLERLVRQTELISHIESTVFCTLINMLPLKIRHWIQNGASLVPSAYRWSIFIRPNDPRDTRIPRDIIEPAIKIARTRIRRFSGPKRKFFRTVSTTSWMQEANPEGRNTAILEKVEEGVSNLTTDTNYIHSTMVFLNKKIDRMEESMGILEMQLGKVLSLLQEGTKETVVDSEDS